ncbi:hypothetical protein LCGC14_2178770 [marine sediment metagenome]|uniref:Uncharacterized protein n=1 Tax=marine sediment metagenome TaxID=412755 RepID=A0A0F9DMX7_9ZZZZ
MSYDSRVLRKEKRRMKQMQHISDLDFSCADTYTLAKFILQGNKNEKGAAGFEWEERTGKPFPYHPSYDDDTYPVGYVKRVQKSKGTL